MSSSNKIIRLPATIAKTGLSRSTIYSFEKLNKFPKKIKLGERSMGWLESEIDTWIEAKAANREG
jgi:prophage regulatory protein